MTTTPNPKTTQLTQLTYGIEFFHIYTDEKINEMHTKSIDVLRDVQATLPGETKSIVFIDNYNPTEHILGSQQVLDYLHQQDVLPDYWAFEADVVGNAQKLLRAINKPHLQRSYEKYIASHDKFPCSLLTASWYLTRLGIFESDFIQSSFGDSYEPVDRLVNILPEAYVSVEKRAREVIQHSPYAHCLDQIEYRLYNADEGHAPSLF